MACRQDDVHWGPISHSSFGHKFARCTVQRGSEFYCFFIGTDIGGMCGVRIARSGDPWGQPGSW